jgi:uncharacterized lipoprotein NlpE involved in copper resistance
MKKLIFTLFVVLSLAACNNSSEQAASNKDAEATEADAPKVITVDELEANIADLVGQTVVVAGDVDHVCKHGGTKMVILGDSTDIHIKATDESGNFRADEVMHHRVIVTGEVDEFRVDEDYIAQKEAELEELKAGGAEEETEAEEEEHEERGMFPDNDNKHKKQIAGLERQIESLKKMLEEARAEGKDHVSFYSVKAVTYEIDEDAEVTSEAKHFDDSPAEMAAEQESAKQEAAEESSDK